jgi:hypothetical protein
MIIFQKGYNAKVTSRKGEKPSVDSILTKNFD